MKKRRESRKLVKQLNRLEKSSSCGVAVSWAARSKTEYERAVELGFVGGWDSWEAYGQYMSEVRRQWPKAVWLQKTPDEIATALEVHGLPNTGHGRSQVYSRIFHASLVEPERYCSICIYQNRTNDPDKPPAAVTIAVHDEQGDTVHHQEVIRPQENVSPESLISHIADIAARFGCKKLLLPGEYQALEVCTCCGEPLIQIHDGQGRKMKSYKPHAG